MNIRDSEVIAGMLRTKSYELTAKPEDADVAIFNTCSVRQHAEDKVWSEIGRIVKLSNRKNPHRTPPANRTPPLTGAHRRNFDSASGETANRPLIGLIGCMAQNYKETVFERQPAVDFVVGPADIGKIPEIIENLLKGTGFYQRKMIETDGVSRPEEIYHTGYYCETEHAYVVISEGCGNFCSYCIVPFVRGPLRNRAHKEIVKEIEGAVSKGIRKFTLLGQNVNAYSDKGTDFKALVSLVNAIDGVEQFGFITSHPRDTTLELFETLAKSEKFNGYLHLPVQAGSDRILKLMNRGYTRKYYLDLAQKYRTIVSHGSLTTDIIVGFPTETEDDFQETVELVRNVEFDVAFIFKYSPRPMSEAFTWQDDVSIEDKQRRHAFLLDLQKSISRKKSDSKKK